VVCATEYVRGVGPRSFHAIGMDAGAPGRVRVENAAIDVFVRLFLR
jgi:hypothetical protein